MDKSISQLIRQAVSHLTMMGEVAKEDSQPTAHLSAIVAMLGEALTASEKLENRVKELETIMDSRGKLDQMLAADSRSILKIFNEQKV
jgi:hypothetical protein